MIIVVFSFRGLFVIDKAGTLRQMTINDLPVGRDVDETLRLVQVTLFSTRNFDCCKKWERSWRLLLRLSISLMGIFDYCLEWERKICDLKIDKLSLRLSSSLMSMVRFALLDGDLVRFVWTEFWSKSPRNRWGFFLMDLSTSKWMGISCPKF